MKVFNHIVFIVVLMLGLAIAAWAQKPEGEQGKPPRKEEAPKFVVAPKEKPPPREERPKGDGKKPVFASIGRKEDSDNSV